MQGIHICKFYVGRAHFIASMMISLKEAIDEDMLFIYSSSEDFNDKLYSYFNKLLNTANNTYSNDEMRAEFNNKVKWIRLGEFGTIDNVENPKSTYDMIKKIITKVPNKTLKGVYLFIQMDQAYYMLGKEKLLKLEKNIEIVIKDLNLKLVCLYDVFNSYKNGIIDEIMDIHEYSSHCSNIYKTEELFKS